MQQLAAIEPELVAALAAEGARFTHHSSIAPTGTIALSLANNASNGIEPSFAHHYSRNVIREGKKTKDKLDVCSFELLAYRELVNADASPDAEAAEDRLPGYFVEAEDITPASACRHPGGGAEVDRLFHLQNDQCAIRLSFRRLQRCLHVRL